MGLFDNFKKSDEEKIDEALTKYNIFEGIECEVTFPDTQLKITTHGGVTRGAATLAFGIIGSLGAGAITPLTGYVLSRAFVHIASGHYHQIQFPENRRDKAASARHAWCSRNIGQYPPGWSLPLPRRRAYRARRRELLLLLLRDVRYHRKDPRLPGGLPLLGSEALGA